MRTVRVLETSVLSLPNFFPIYVLLLALQVGFVSSARSQVCCEGPAFDQSQVGVSGSFSDCLGQPANSIDSPTPFDGGYRACRPIGTLTGFFGLDGSKQPQDFGANANLGAAAQLGYSGPLLPDYGIGFQIGSRVTLSANAVQVYELLGEADDRFQSFTTVGVFQRTTHGFAFGVVYDYLTQESFDNFSLGQWRFRASYDVSPVDEIGVTLNFSDRSDSGRFNATNVELEPVEQLHIYLRRRWQSGVNTSFWMGVADKHSEENVLTGTLPPKSNQVLFGAEIFAPLNNWMAIYGETNLVMPADTGAVDAYLGIEIAPQGIHRSRSRQNRFRALLPVASNPTFTTDLNRR